MNIFNKIKSLFQKPKGKYAVLLHDGANYILSSSVFDTEHQAIQWANELERNTRSFAVIGVISFQLP